MDIGLSGCIKYMNICVCKQKLYTYMYNTGIPKMCKFYREKLTTSNKSTFTTMKRLTQTKILQK